MKQTDKIIILRGREDHHAYRLANGLFGCELRGGTLVLDDANPNYKEALKFLTEQKFDVAFVEASTDIDLSEAINADRIILFDCEDDPYHFDPKKAYYSLKDKCEFYAKLVYDSSIPMNEDGLQYINIPLDNYTRLSEIASIPLEKKTLDDPCFIGVPSYKNFWKPKKEHYHCIGEGFNPIAEFVPDQSLIYNQRLDWLATLAEHDIPVRGGVVFNTDPNHPHGEEFQVKHFGEKVRSLGVPRVDPTAALSELLFTKIGLAPTGHDRYSWRIFDLMATGGIIISTDLGDRTMLYDPKQKVIVKDGENVAHVIDAVKEDQGALLDAHLENREVLKDLTPSKMWSDFLKQMES